MEVIKTETIVTIPKKATAVAETSTITNKGCYYMKFFTSQEACSSSANRAIPQQACIILGHTKGSGREDKSFAEKSPFPCDSTAFFLFSKVSK